MTGYPQFSIVLVLAIGFILAIRRPYNAFLLAVLIIGAGSTSKLNLTRTELLGPYFNLMDACVLVALFALLSECASYRRQPQIPRIVLFIVTVLFIASLQSFAIFGFNYEIVRSFRWAIQFPLAIFLAANFVTDYHRAKLFVTTLLIAAILAATQHVIHIVAVGQENIYGTNSFEELRTISYSSGGLAEIFLLSILIWKLPKMIYSKLFFIVIGSLFIVSVIMNQTRSVWFAMIITIPLLIRIFQLRQKYNTFFCTIVTVTASMVLAILLCNFLIPELDISGMIKERISLLFDTSSATLITGGPTSGRSNAIKVELNHWLNGTLVFGRGLNYFENMKSRLTDIAFGHVGYITYLSQLGLVGFLAYAVFLPYSVIRNCKQVWFNSHISIVRYAVFLSGTSMIFHSVMFVMSASFLGLGSFIPGVLAGMAWSVARIGIADIRQVQSGENIAFINKYRRVRLCRNEKIF